MVRQHNPYVKNLKAALDLCSDDSNLQLVLHAEEWGLHSPHGAFPPRCRAWGSTVLSQVRRDSGPAWEEKLFPRGGAV
jgi:hypothetical protein